MVTRFPLATSRYQAREAIIASELAPIRITLGRPRFRLGYELAGELRILAPTPREFRLTGDAFKTAYLQRMNDIGAWLIAQRLCDLHFQTGRGLVLCCFEDVAAGEQCHRTTWREWFQAETGWPVWELELSA